MNTEMKEKFYTCRSDIMFKTVICSDNDIDFLKEFLSRVLHKNITSLEYLRNELDVNYPLERKKIVDFVALIDGEYIHIELDTCHSLYRRVRNFSYFASLYAKKTTKGASYDIKSKFIHIDFTFGMPKKYPIERHFKLRADDNYEEKTYIDNLEIIITFNLDRIKEFLYNKNEEEINKFKHLIMLDCNKEELDLLEHYSKGDDFVSDYKDKVNKLNEDHTFRSLMTKEEDDLYILNTEKELAFEAGEKQGVEQGIQENKLVVAKNLLNLEMTDDIIIKSVKIA